MKTEIEKLARRENKISLVEQRGNNAGTYTRFDAYNFSSRRKNAKKR